MGSWDTYKQALASTDDPDEIRRIIKLGQARLTELTDGEDNSDNGSEDNGKKQKGWKVGDMCYGPLKKVPGQKKQLRFEASVLRVKDDGSGTIKYDKGPWEEFSMKGDRVEVIEDMTDDDQIAPRKEESGDGE